MAERLTPGILDLEVWGSSVVSLDKELSAPLCLSSPSDTIGYTLLGVGE